MFGKPSLGLLRSLSRELRRRSAPGSRLLPRPLVQWMLSEYKANRVTDTQYCRGPAELTWVADAYLQYVRAQRECRALTKRHQRREKTVQQTADMIGFTLPSKTPQDKTH